MVIRESQGNHDTGRARGHGFTIRDWYKCRVEKPSRGYRYSSARRGRKWPTPPLIVAVTIVILVTLVAVMSRQKQPEVVEIPPQPYPPAVPTAAPSATPTATEIVELRSDWVSAAVPEATATPWPTPPPPIRREPTPTPRVSECVGYRWTTVQILRPSAHVLTEIKAVNNCTHDIDPLELLFEISGWRDGALVQSVRARPFDRIRRRHSGIISVGLPGSLDWYDNITVEIID